jgi:hypothetical protein
MFIHNDLFVENLRWYKQVEGAFNGNKKLGLLGFVGSWDWSYDGGRGTGTMGSFQGKTFDGFVGGSHISLHGEDVTGQLRNACQLDGCSMVFRRQTLESIGFRDDLFFHFYDRIMSAQVLERGWQIAVLGIECDHLSGKTMGEVSYDRACEKWCNEHLGITDKNEWVSRNFT